MSDLRLIILVVGIVVIAIIYFWETIKQKQEQRKQAFSKRFSDQDVSGITLAPARNDDNDYAGVLSELNRTLSDSKRREDISEHSSIQLNEEEKDIPGEEEEIVSAAIPDTRDMFEGLDSEGQDLDEGKPDSAGDVNDEQIVILHVTAMPTRAFKGNDILDAVNNLGLEYGDMNIFHHFGVGDIQSDAPLFSMVDMFEPGSFDLGNIEKHQTRGLSLFFRPSAEVDGQVVFELMLNTAHRLAKLLGAEIRGADHELINDRQIAAIREKINQSGNQHIGARH